MKYEIGDFVVDEDGTVGVVCIKYSDGDTVLYENDAAHPNPLPLAALWPNCEFLRPFGVGMGCRKGVMD